MNPPVGPVKVAEAVTKIMTMLLGEDAVDVEVVLSDAAAGVCDGAELLFGEAVGWSVIGTTTTGGLDTAALDAAALGVLVSAVICVDPAATGKSGAEVEVCAAASLLPLLAVPELSDPASSENPLELALSVVVTGLCESIGGKGCVTLKVVSTVAIIVVSTFTVVGVGCAVVSAVELVVVVTVVSGFGNAGIGNIVVDCASVRSDTPDASCLLRRLSSDPPNIPFTTHLRCSSFARRTALLLLSL